MQKSPLFLALVLCLVSVNCWWEIGHITVAQIAEKRLKALG